MLKVSTVSRLALTRTRVKDLENMGNLLFE